MLKTCLLVLCLLAATGNATATDQAGGVSPYTTAQSSADQTAGEKLYMEKGCIECHGPRGYSEDPDMFPKIAGLEQQYIVDQLLAFQSGSRQNVIMSPVASTLTTDDITALAAFIAAKH